MGGVRRADARQLPFFHPRLRRADAQAAAPGRGRRLPGGDARQHEQPRARRRAGDARRWRRRSCANSPRCSAAGRRARPPDRERHDRQPRGAVGRARAAPGQGGRLQRQAHYTHSRMCGVLGRARARAIAADARGPDRPRRARGRAARPAAIGTVVRRPARPALGAVDRVDEALALRERYGVRLHVDAAYGGFFTLLADTGARARARRSSRSPSATRSSSIRTSTACSPTAAARCCSATRRSGGSTSTTRPTPTSRRRSCTSARSASSARAPARRRPRCG